jgi:replicative DNA helicase
MGELWNEGYESGLISILLNADLDTILDTRSKLSVKDFKSNISACLFGIICHLSAEGRELTDMNLAAELIKYKPTVNEMGGETKIFETLSLLREMDASANDMQYYIEGVQKFSLLRQFMDKNDQLKQVILNEGEKMTIDEVVNLPEKTFLEISQFKTVDGFQIANGMEDEFINCDPSTIGKMIGIPSRWLSFNGILLGYEPGYTYVTSGFTNQGKSIVLENEADHIGINLQVPTLYIDTEMVKTQIQSRMLSIRTNIDVYTLKLKKHLKHGNDELKRKVLKAINDVKTAPLYFVTPDEFDEETIQRIVKYYIVRYGVRLVIFDYIKMPQVDSRTNLKEHQLLGNLTNCLKNKVAKNMGVALLTACQTDQKERDREADSARIRRFSDVLGTWQKKDEKMLKDEGNDTDMGSHYYQFLKIRDGSGEMPKVNFQFVKNSSEIIEANNSHLSFYHNLIKK